MYISEEQIEQVRKSCDIVAIAGQITRLRKKKNSLWGRCPFCNDKGKHFAVKEDKQIYYCFNCRRAGDAISLYKDMKGVTYGTAVRELAELNGVELGVKQI